MEIYGKRSHKAEVKWEKGEVRFHVLASRGSHVDHKGAFWGIQGGFNLVLTATQETARRGGECRGDLPTRRFAGSNKQTS